MFELGKRGEIPGEELIQPLTLSSFVEAEPGGRPIRMPRVPEGHKVICGYDQGLGERMIVCDNIEDMQQLYDAYAKGCALYINWYSGPGPEFVVVIGGPQPEETK